jgi:hypothetical protein
MGNNNGTIWRYVASNTMTSHEWQPSVFLNGDIAEKVAKIKQQHGPDMHVWGSGNLIQTLIKHDLVDAFWLVIYPITLGVGKRLFADGTIPERYICSFPPVSFACSSMDAPLSPNHQRDRLGRGRRPRCPAVRFAPRS